VTIHHSFFAQNKTNYKSSVQLRDSFPHNLIADSVVRRFTPVSYSSSPGIHTDLGKLCFIQEHLNGG